jgi:hypothetical protein
VTNATKDKGDVGVACVVADLTKRGIKIALPLSEHLPFDLIAISLDGALARVSVKYRTATNGYLEITTKTVWSNRKGAHIKHVDKTWLDGVAVYCPDTTMCYYLPISAFNSKHELRLRVAEPESKRAREQASKMSFADKFADPSVLWKMEDGTGLPPDPN